MAHVSWDHITVTAKKPVKAWSTKRKAQFQYFNPNGVMAKFYKMGETITQYVDAGIITSGWHLAYGTLNYFHSEKIVEMVSGDHKNVRQFDYFYHTEELNKQIDKAYNKLAEEIMGE